MNLSPLKGNKPPIAVIMLVTATFIFLGFFLNATTSIHSDSEPYPVELKDGWKYRWGDSPVDDSGMPLWTSDKLNSGEWNDYSLKSVGMERNKLYQYVWFAVKIPEDSSDSTSIFFNRITTQAVDIYIDGEKIYSYALSSMAQKDFLPSSKRLLIPLMHDVSGKTLFIRAYSSHDRVGPCTSVLIGAYDKLSNILMCADLSNLILGFFFLIFGIIVTPIVFFLHSHERKTFISLSLFVVCMGIWQLVQYLIFNQIIFVETVYWHFLFVLSMHLAAIFLAYFLEQIFGPGYRFIIRRIWVIYIVLTIIFAVIFFIGILPGQNLSAMLGAYVNIFYFLAIVVLVILMSVVLVNAIKGDTDAKIFTFGFIIYAFIVISDLSMISFIPGFKRPSISKWSMLIFIASLVTILGRRFYDAHRRLVIYSNELESKNKMLDHMWREVKESRDQLNEWNKTLEQTVANRTSEIRNLLNNAGQGFLTFGEDLLIHKEYSSECINLFGSEIENKKLSELIYMDEEHRKYLDLTFIKLLRGISRNKINLYLPLLPAEVFINNKYIKIEYKIIENPDDQSTRCFMAILTDITDKKFLENRMEEERKTLRMVVKAVTNNNELKRVIKDYEDFCEYGIRDILKSERSIGDMVFEIFRSIHTFKGSFSQLEMFNIVSKLHEFETEISDLGKTADNLDISDLEDFLEAHKVQSWLDEDLFNLKQILGEQFFTPGNTIIIEESRILQIEEKLQDLLPSQECQILVSALKDLRYKPFKSLFKSYEGYVMNLAERFKKPVNPFQITGDDIRVNTDKYHTFSRSLVHIFRNIFDHGIEPIEERIKYGKEVYGSVGFNIELKDGHFKITISDDGRGLDVNSLREKAVENGYYDRAAADKLPESEILALIFKDTFTTRKEVTEFSGRGIGLAAVKKEVDKLGGSIEVKTQTGKGSEFIFILPILD